MKSCLGLQALPQKSEHMSSIESTEDTRDPMSVSLPDNTSDPLLQSDTIGMDIIQENTDSIIPPIGTPLEDITPPVDTPQGANMDPNLPLIDTTVTAGDKPEVLEEFNVESVQEVPEDQKEVPWVQEGIRAPPLSDKFYSIAPESKEEIMSSDVLREGVTKRVPIHEGDNVPLKVTPMVSSPPPAPVVPTQHSLQKQQKFYESSLPDWSRYLWSLFYKSSPVLLNQSECRMLQALDNRYTLWNVNIAPNTFIHTLHIKHSSAYPSNRPPLLVLHGMGAGIGLFVKNLDTFSEHTDVYAIDILGFGRSSKPIFSNKPNELIGQFVQSIEDWRSAVGLKQLILLGHSFGGFIATNYALKFPDRVVKLVLAEPWGFPALTTSRGNRNARYKGFRCRVFILLVSMVTIYLKLFQPFSFIRWSFGFAKYLLLFTRSDLTKLFIGCVYPEELCSYIYHFNCQYPSGEMAFSNLHIPFGKCNYSLLPDRILQIDSGIPIHFLYGTDSWISSNSGFSSKYLLTNSVTVDIIEGASHHIYGENTGKFNLLVCEYLKQVC
ncbi:Abhydrolase domain-containing protein 4-like [Oopsacas minuta]|uniref:Abhydrolase domain-containing protein 4-like n=1 Tax=Oopsacas minuta TaxID=111878 RepID=A0AAV7K2M5_9METZ|nr:Abhydrolase domain-containing protein 4-like [Oopsacas minuta]